jgi:4a-hydroxytetrahydrobiopterin dehydratase
VTAKFTGPDRAKAIATLPKWQEVPGRDAIKRSPEVRRRQRGLGLHKLGGVALAAEKADHHPEWSNVYSNVEVVLSTRNAGGLTDKDVALAKMIDSLA